ncbi:hypothetical protein CSKR_105142 [Clonorchis sinensis]|uniref:Uncharacterized protein n=1 Tax=Clonorchis sinensis TaxID=79923 RepID=A0A419PK23_CLOSI|nr:hypothetical protein CSKR_105142 [Clonorchis sinensis]
MLVEEGSSSTTVHSSKPNESSVRARNACCPACFRVRTLKAVRQTERRGLKINFEKSEDIDARGADVACKTDPERTESLVLTPGPTGRELLMELGGGKEMYMKGSTSKAVSPSAGTCRDSKQISASEEVVGCAPKFILFNNEYQEQEYTAQYKVTWLLFYPFCHSNTINLPLPALYSTSDVSLVAERSSARTGPFPRMRSLSLLVHGKVAGSASRRSQGLGIRRSCGLYIKGAMHSATKKGASKNETNIPLLNQEVQCKCSSLIGILDAKLELLSSALEDANTKNAAARAKVDKELSSLNGYLVLFIP